MPSRCSAQRRTRTSTCTNDQLWPMSNTHLLNLKKCFLLSCIFLNYSQHLKLKAAQYNYCRWLLGRGLSTFPPNKSQNCFYRLEASTHTTFCCGTYCSHLKCRPEQNIFVVHDDLLLYLFENIDSRL